jgi:hypothetical protein
MAEIHPFAAVLELQGDGRLVVEAGYMGSFARRMPSRSIMASPLIPANVVPCRRRPPCMRL